MTAVPATAAGAKRSPPLLTASGLGCNRADIGLWQGLNFELRRGELLALKGPNGCGKSTLLRVLAGLFDDYEGEFSFSGEGCLYLGHAHGLKPSLSVRDNLCWLCCMHGAPTEPVDAVLEEIGLAARAGSPFGALSAGQRQRVALARFRLLSGALWLLDEPFASLDPDGLRKLFAMLRLHIAAGGAGLIALPAAAPADSGQALHLEAFVPAIDTVPWTAEHSGSKQPLGDRGGQAYHRGEACEPDEQQVVGASGRIQSEGRARQSRAAEGSTGRWQ